MIRLYAKVLALFLLFSAAVAVGQNKAFSVDVSRVMNTVPDKLYGACIEDVNHEIYGGLYDQKIFGESFEEPAPSAHYQGWRSYDGDWQLNRKVLRVNSGPGYKLVTDAVFPVNYRCSVSLKFGKTVTNAGLLIGVQNAGVGADSFDGYEISLDPNRQRVILGKHSHNWTPIKEVSAHFDPQKWTQIKVDVKDLKIRVYINTDPAPILIFNASRAGLHAGHFGLRTYDADVSFKDVAFNEGQGFVPMDFSATPSVAVSRAWEPISAPPIGKDEKAFQIDKSDAYNGRQSQVIIHRDATDGNPTGIFNKGLNKWGIAYKKGHRYDGSLYLKAVGASTPVIVALQNASGTINYATYTITGLSLNWQRFNFSMQAGQTDSSGRFAIMLPKSGKVKIDQVTLQSEPKDQFGGQPFRKDIASMMQAEGLNFLRYGGTMVNAPGYKWKKMIGPRGKRPPYKGHWYPYSTNGFGIEEFLQFCEIAGFEPAFAINIEESPQDVADMIDYLKADSSNYWGRQRMANGHALPYKVKYIEIGNEEVINEDAAAGYAHYIDRFNLLYQAMHQKDTTIEFIISAWWRPASENMKTVFQALENKASYWDLHTDADDPDAGTKVDATLTQMQMLFRKWDPNSQLKCTIFEENGSHHNLARALGHATTLNAVRKHGDFVLTSCAANALQPLGQNDNDWDQGQIFFTPADVWGMPPFYAQKMAAQSGQDLRVFATTNADLDFTATVSRDRKHLVLQVVNTRSKSVTTSLNFKHFGGIRDTFVAKVLYGKLKDENTEVHPQRISTISNRLSWQKCLGAFTFKPNSYTVLEFNQ